MQRTAKRPLYRLATATVFALAAVFILSTLPSFSHAARPLKRWAVNVKSFLVAEEARAAAEVFNAAGYNAYVTQADVRGKHYFRLRIGFYSTRKEALTQAAGMDAVYKTEDPWAVKVSPKEAAEHPAPENLTARKKPVAAKPSPIPAPQEAVNEPAPPETAIEMPVAKTSPPPFISDNQPQPAEKKAEQKPVVKMTAPDAGPEPVELSDDGNLRINIYKDFKYVPSGWPMGLSVGQSDAAGLKSAPFETLKREPAYTSPKPLYGYMRLGNSDDPVVSFALDKVESRQWELYIDKNNNEDLSDDGPPIQNQGTLKMSSTVELDIDIVMPDKTVVRTPYKFWFFIGTGGPHLYATCHYAGRIRINNVVVYDAIAFEEFFHDGLFKESGVCVDVNRDGKCSREQEVFKDGEALIDNGKRYTFKLDYP